MGNEQDLMQKLMISKKIMEKHNNIGRGQSPNVDTNRSIDVQSFQPVQGNYNIPQEFLQEQQIQKSYSNEPQSEDRILNSKLPDEIKKLMIEHPIEQPNNMMGGPTITNELADKAARLMNVNAKGEQTNQSTQKQNLQEGSLNFDMKNIIRETIEDVLRENGLITESETTNNDVFKFRVGKHIFEGRLTKVKKIAK